VDSGSKTSPVKTPQGSLDIQDFEEFS